MIATGQAGEGEAPAWMRLTAGFCLLMLTAWLVLSLHWVGIELDDGYATIVNAQHLLGISDHWIWSRGPLPAVLLMPAEWLAQSLGLDALDVRPHHAVFVALHLAHAWLAWRLLCRVHGQRLATLIAWVAAVPTVAWTSYAAFISHDILPGLLLLILLVLAGEHLKRPRRPLWLGMVAIGFLAAGFKHLMAAVWVVVLLGWAMALVTSNSDRTQHSARRWLQLLAASVASAVLAVLAYGLSLESTFPDTPLWQRPFLQVQAISSYWHLWGDPGEYIYQWVYLRNLWIYGLLTSCLLLPGLWFSWRSGRPLLRAGVIAFLCLAALLQLAPFKEARYALVLAPLAALLLVPAIDAMLALRRTWLWPMLALLALDLAMASHEALRLRHPFYRDAVPAFLASLPRGEGEGKIVMTGFLNFIAPDRWAFHGDRYHRIVHLADVQLGPLLGYPKSRLLRRQDLRAITMEDFVAGDHLVYVNDQIARVTPIAPDNRSSMQPYFAQLVARAENLALIRENGIYRIHPGGTRPIMLLPTRAGGGEPLVTTDGQFEATALARTIGLEGRPERVTAIGMELAAWCNPDGCRYW